MTNGTFTEAKQHLSTGNTGDKLPALAQRDHICHRLCANANRVLLNAPDFKPLPVYPFNSFIRTSYNPAGLCTRA